MNKDYEEKANSHFESSNKQSFSGTPNSSRARMGSFYGSGIPADRESISEEPTPAHFANTDDEDAIEFDEENDVMSFSDEHIEEQVWQAFEENPTIDPGQISVRVEDGVVYVTGAVEDNETKNAVTEALAQCESVKTSRNDLRVAYKKLNTHFNASTERPSGLPAQATSKISRLPSN